MNNFRKIILNLIHIKNIKNDCCSKKYPWGWRSQDKIKLINNKNKEKIEIPDELLENSQIHKTHFEIGAKQGYKIIFEYCNHNIDFLDYSFTNPSLSIGLNYLNTNNIEDISFENIQVNIIDEWYEKNTININSNYFGLFDKKEFLHNFIAGGLGPEWTHIWDQEGIKQIIRVKYTLPDRIDIWDWERNIINEDFTWQIRNINEIIIYQNP